jgi:hypothetical protein
MALGILRRLFGRGEANGTSDNRHHVIQILTPTAASGRSIGSRVALAGATVAGLVVAAGVALGALAMLFLALGAIYFLLTQVLGIKLDLDPRQFVERAQQYAAANAAGRN